ncbi:MAG: DUF1588 domain-containing protein [Verrucomicrobiales bacterium]|nr:DUF1588 domain-containing protein [Verrucomicrobiales bacterium]
MKFFATVTLLSFSLSAVCEENPGNRNAFEAAIDQLVSQHCYECHDDLTAEGELDLTALTFDFSDPKVFSKWTHIHDRVEKGEMPPPEKAENFSGKQRGELVALLGDKLREADRADIWKNGRLPMRRLTRSEYEDSLRDLLALPQLDIQSRLPEDRVSHGYTKVASLLDMSRVHLDAYLDASEAALLSAVAPSVKPTPATKKRFTGTDLFASLTTFGGREAMFFVKDGKMTTLNNENLKVMTPEERADSKLELAIFRSATWPYFGYPKNFRAPRTGEYRVKFSGRAVRQVRDFRIVPAHSPQPISFRARQPSGPDVSGDVRETGGWMDLQPENKTFETTIHLRKGETFEYSLLGLPVPFIRTDGGFFYDFPPMPPAGHRGGVIQWLEIEGPVVPKSWPPESHHVLFGDLPIGEKIDNSSLAVSIQSENPAADVKRLFNRFGKRFSKGPLTDEDKAPFLKLAQNRLESGVPPGDALISAYQAFLSSRHFLYHPQRSSPHTVANRLSHFLWNSIPDKALTNSPPTEIEIQAQRLIADEKFERFVNGFTNEWLDLRDLRRDIPDNRLYPEYRKDDYLVDSMEKETRAFFGAMIRENLPITYIVDAPFTFANDRLARHYDLPKIGGSELRKVELAGWSPYGGILTQASILKHTANGTTTSPVLRGVWVMEKILGEPPPPPPKSVPAIEPDIRGAQTIRAILDKHTKVESCANCHARFDPVGYALENFDVMGSWRDRYRSLEKGEKITGYDPAGHPYTYYVGKFVESDGQLRSGETFADIHELKKHLAAKPRQLARNFLHQLTQYATGAGVRFSERDEIEEMLDACEADGFRARDLLISLVESRIFLEQK